jgi:hypothetical protein
MTQSYDSTGKLVDRRERGDRRMPKTVCMCVYSVPIESVSMPDGDGGWLRKVTVVMCPMCLRRRQVK